MKSDAEFDPHRRYVLYALSATTAAPMPWILGCAKHRPFPQPQIVDEPPEGLRPILKPGPIIKARSAPSRVVDVHAHFFNAKDVPVAGYLAGPVAHSRPGPLGDLIRALAPIADTLAVLAPGAAHEYEDLIHRASSSRLRATTPQEIQDELEKDRLEYLKELSPKAFRLLQGSAFETEFNLQKERMSESAKTLLREEAQPLSADSLFNVMQRGSERLQLDGKALAHALTQDAALLDYPDGVLEFLGHMLSFRWMNLLAYQRAYSTGHGAFGVDQVYGALVDFDHWLMPPARVAHQDQIRLHQLLSILSDGYMRPLAAYNPWSDVEHRGHTLQQVLDAIDRRGFVGVKIYPPNGFRPWGNAANPLPHPGAPSAADLDRVLLKLWRECAQRGIPVMAHGGHSMGRDDAHDDMAGPQGWKALLDRMQSEPTPVINVGHFGGDDPSPEWTESLAGLMAHPQGTKLYGDIGYWSNLRCTHPSSACVAKDRLKRLVMQHPVVRDRVMYGSDWLMLSQERRWDRFPFDIAESTSNLVDATALFAGNADRCFANATLPPVRRGASL